MPETSIFDALPTTDALGPALAMLPTSVSLPAVDVTSLGADIGRSAPGGGDPLAGTMPDLSAAPSTAAFRRALDEPLAAATAIDGPSLIAGARGSLPAQAPAPAFDVQGVIKGITDPVLPAGTGVTVPASIPMPAELGDFSAPLRRLGEAGAATPLRLLQAMLAVLQKLVETATDVDRIKTYTAEALGEILVAQTGILRDRLPLATLEQARAAFDSGYLDRIEKLLADLDRVKAATGDDLLNVVEAVREGAVPALRHYREAAETLGYLKADEVEPLTRALEGVTGFATGGEVFLQGPFESIEAKAASILDAVGGPVQELADMIEQIRGYLQQAAQMAGDAAQTVADNLDAALRTVSDSLKTAREQIETIAAQVRAFIEQVDVSDAIEAFKGGCTTLATNVDGFFTQVEEARQQLDAAVTELSATVEARFDEGLAELEKQIRRMLGEITGVLDRADVKQVLDQAREGCRQAQGGHRPGLAAGGVRRGGAQDGRAGGAGARHRHLAAGHAAEDGAQGGRKDHQGSQHRRRGAAGAGGRLRRDPGAPARADRPASRPRSRRRGADRRLSARDAGRGGHRPAPAEAVRPAGLVPPLAGARAGQGRAGGAAEGAGAAGPQRLVDRLQGAYGQLRELVDALEPTPLNAEMSRVANTAIRQITSLRDVHLEDAAAPPCARTCRCTKLLEGTGVQEIADARAVGPAAPYAGRRATWTRSPPRVDGRAGRGWARSSARWTTATRPRRWSPCARRWRRSAPSTADGLLVPRRGLLRHGAGGGGGAGGGAGAAARRAAGRAAPWSRAEVEDALRQLELKPVTELLAALRAVAGA